MTFQEARPPRRGDAAAVVRPRHLAHGAGAARVALLGGGVGRRTRPRPGRRPPPPGRRMVRQARADLQRRHHRGPPRSMAPAGSIGFIAVPPGRRNRRNLRRPAATAHGHPPPHGLKRGKSSENTFCFLPRTFRHPSNTADARRGRTFVRASPTELSTAPMDAHPPGPVLS